jgi:cytoskeleton protein RodZ
MDQLELEASNKNNCNDDDISQESTHKITFINKLRNKRVANNMSTADVADQLCLTAEIIERIESLEQNVKHDVFLRGYIRSYARLLKLSDEEINNGLVELGFIKRVKRASGRKLKSSKQSTAKDKPIRLTTYIIIIILGIFVWWQVHDGKESSVTPQVLKQELSTVHGTTQAAANLAEDNSKQTDVSTDASNQIPQSKREQEVDKEKPAKVVTSENKSNLIPIIEEKKVKLNKGEKNEKGEKKAKSGESVLQKKNNETVSANTDENDLPWLSSKRQE